MHFIQFIALLAPFALAYPNPDDSDLRLQRRQHGNPDIYTYERLVRRDYSYSQGGIGTAYSAVRYPSYSYPQSGIGTAYSAVRYPSYNTYNNNNNRHRKKYHHNSYGYGGYQLVRRGGPPVPPTMKPIYYGSSAPAAEPLVRRNGIGTAYSAVRYPSHNNDNRNRHHNKHHRYNNGYGGYKLTRRQCSAYKDANGVVHESGCDNPPTCSYDSNGKLIGCVD